MVGAPPDCNTGTSSTLGIDKAFNERAGCLSSATDDDRSHAGEVTAEAEVCPSLSRWGIKRENAYLTELPSTQQFRQVFMQRYTRMARLGKGNYGHVYAARDIFAERAVAVKVLELNNEDDGCKLGEAHILATIGKHKHVSELLDVVCLPGVALMLVQELFDCSLLTWIRKTRGQPQSSDFVVALLDHLQLGLAHIHKCGCLHRDLSSANVLLLGDVQAPGAWRGAIADFGHGCGPLGMDVDTPRKHYPRKVATLMYRAPELITRPHDPYGAAVDVWSLGCVVADTLTGDIAFDIDIDVENPTHQKCAENYLKRVYAHLGQTPPLSVVGVNEQELYRLSTRTERERFLAMAARIPTPTRDLWLTMLQISTKARIRSRDFPALTAAGALESTEAVAGAASPPGADAAE